VDAVNSVGTHARAVLDKWRDEGADRFDPVRFNVIEALNRRLAAYSGETRRLLDERLSKLLENYANDLERAAVNHDDAGSASLPYAPARSALAGLLDDIAFRARGRGVRAATGATCHPAATYPEVEILDYFRATLVKVSTERQLQQSLDQVPKNAGPLNSSSLVHRSLSLMRELSPAYLQQFLSYVDALSWIEQMNSSSAQAGHATPRAGSARKSERSKAR
jgi:Protein of unknown function (DUF2894)